MAATVLIYVYNGAGPASADITSTPIRYHQAASGTAADANTVDSSNPIPLPGAGETFSWRKHTKINVTVSPAGSISNLRWFSTVSARTGCNFYAWSSASYTQGSASDNAGITSYTDSGNKANNLVGASQRSSTTPLSLNAAGVIISNPTTGVGTQDYVVTQMGIASTYASGPGPTDTLTCTYRYAES